MTSAEQIVEGFDDRHLHTQALARINGIVTRLTVKRDESAAPIAQEVAVLLAKFAPDTKADHRARLMLSTMTTATKTKTRPMLVGSVLRSITELAADTVRVRWLA